jgi:hypothetical protein
MTDGSNPSDWTVRNLGGQGTVKCGRYRVLRTGVIRIVWQGGGPEPKISALANQAAQEAIGAAIKPRRRAWSSPGVQGP